MKFVCGHGTLRLGWLDGDRSKVRQCPRSIISLVDILEAINDACTPPSGATSLLQRVRNDIFVRSQLCRLCPTTEVGAVTPRPHPTTTATPLRHQNPNGSREQANRIGVLPVTLPASPAIRVRILTLPSVLSAQLKKAHLLD
jgi:hypothetical protein